MPSLPQPPSLLHPGQVLTPNQAACWVATLLTSGDAADFETSENLHAVGRTYWASWVKIVSAWVCYAVYSWSLLAPVVLPDRFGY